MCAFAVAHLDAESDVIRIGPTLDFRNAKSFKTLWRERLQSGARCFILDFSETGLLDSTGLGAVFSLLRNVTPVLGGVVFLAPSHPVRVIMQITRIHQIFTSHPTEEAALKALRDSGAHRTAVPSWTVNAC